MNRIQLMGLHYEHRMANDNIVDTDLTLLGTPYNIELTGANCYQKYENKRWVTIDFDEAAAIIDSLCGYQIGVRSREPQMFRMSITISRFEEPQVLRMVGAIATMKTNKEATL